MVDVDIIDPSSPPDAVFSTDPYIQLQLPEVPEIESDPFYQPPEIRSSSIDVIESSTSSVIANPKIKIRTNVKNVPEHLSYLQKGERKKMPINNPTIQEETEEKMIVQSPKSMISNSPTLQDNAEHQDIPNPLLGDDGFYGLDLPPSSALDGPKGYSPARSIDLLVS